ncbi:MAG: hypothetical protein A3H91_11265 [Gammaproteobacteria bacterium RIFCSPLOWO2_02_FULL_61_13]|nr:MAG: hypothetical protein A3H91_11265 [Gammaproteobacteria bacterium RIFCSPLOWO2_02_FULL_61_13]
MNNIKGEYITQWFAKSGQPFDLKLPAWLELKTRLRVVHQFVIPNECEGSLTIKIARFLSHFVASK